MAITLNGSTGVTTTGLTSNGIDDNATSTAITIDSSENVLIGRTSTADTAVGATLRPDGFVQSTRDGNIAADFNRNTSDGDIVRFSKGSSPVGSIGAYGNSGVYIAAPTSGGSALIFNDNAPILYPAKNNSGTIAVADNAIDLGASGVRFKDLYLSGGAYLGGTGSANKLDDFEEGIFTATVTPSGTGSMTLDSSQDELRYSKIGKRVFITGGVVISSSSSPTGNMRISLPYIVTNSGSANNSRRSTGSVWISNAGENVYEYQLFIINGESYARIYKGIGTALESNSAQTMSSNNSIYVNFSYETTS